MENQKLLEKMALEPLKQQGIFLANIAIIYLGMTILLFAAGVCISLLVFLCDTPPTKELGVGMGVLTALATLLSIIFAVIFLAMGIASVFESNRLTANHTQALKEFQEKYPEEKK